MSITACWEKIKEGDPKWMEEYTKVVLWGRNHEFPSGNEEDEESREIYCWIKKQKDLFWDLFAKFRKEKMIVLSVSENFDWASSNPTYWDVGYTFYKENPLSETGKLWAISQRRFKKKDLLTERKMALLEQLPEWTWEVDEPSVEDISSIFISDDDIIPSPKNEEIEEFNELEDIRKELKSMDTEWYSSYMNLLEFYKKNKRLPREKENYALHRWASSNKYNLQYRNFEMNHKRAMLISHTIDIWDWCGYFESWEKNYLQYMNNLNFRNCSRTKWANSQKWARDKGYLTQDKIEKLDQLPEWSWDYNYPLPKDDSKRKRVEDPDYIPRKRGKVKEEKRGDPSVGFLECSKCKDCSFSKEGNPLLQTFEEIKPGTWFSDLKFICVDCIADKK